MPARSLIVLTDRSPNDFCSSSSRTALTMASRCRSPLVRRMPGGADSAVMARLSHRPTPETNLTCVKYGREDRHSGEIHHNVFKIAGASMATISTPNYLLDQARRRLTPTVNTIPGMGLAEKR